jgi:transcriptional regulator with PAS, ATPase and Fis domain
MKKGAFDYLVKGDDNSKIIPLVAKAAEKARLQFRIQHLEERVSKQYGFANIIGKSKAIRETTELSRKVALSDTTVLLTGATGTGKEIFAHAIHAESPRKNASFVALNCSAFGKDLLESEMFGHKAGAFTGASRDKKGLIEEAHQGTLFLDEISEFQPELQAKLLRVLESCTFIKVGETKETKVNVRIIAATNRNLENEIQKGNFREDLFYRISAFTIHLPGLDERKEDIPLLAEHFMQQFTIKMQKKIKGIHQDFLQALQAHSWKGNIRELRNIIERAVILCENEQLTNDLLPFNFQHTGAQSVSAGVFKLQDIEKSHILNLLRYTKGNKTKTAELLGIGLTTLYRKIQEYDLE